ncbi:MAG: hypothetical protein M1816_005702 [Peltula sp. TS41687]|nr:MAG: hypothetical protein M1816_005702 [Peltula sp. TS41687]
MDPHHQRALDALQPFLALSKSATSPHAAADLVTRATSAPNTYVFAELLSTPNIQSLRQAGPDFSPYLTLLEIFSWGTWQDYHSALTLSTPRQLEDLIITATYAGLLAAKLSPSTGQVHVSSLSALRDLSPGSVPRLLDVLTDWHGRCADVLADVEAQIKEVRRRAGERRKADEDMQRAVEKALLVHSEAKGTGKRGAPADAAAGTGAGAGAGAASAGAKVEGDEGLGGEGEPAAGWEGEAMDVDDVGAGGEGLGIGGGGGGDGRTASGSALGGPAGGQRKNARIRSGGVGRRGG